MGQIPPEPAHPLRIHRRRYRRHVERRPRGDRDLGVCRTWVAVALLWTPTMPAGDENRPVEFPTVPVMSRPSLDPTASPYHLSSRRSPPRAGQPSGVERAACGAGRQSTPLTFAAAGEAPRATPREPEAPSGSAPQLLPENAPTPPSTLSPKTDRWENSTSPQAQGL